MVEKIIKFVIILVFAALGVFLMEIATPLSGRWSLGIWVKPPLRR